MLKIYIVDDESNRRKKIKDYLKQEFNRENDIIDDFGDANEFLKKAQINKDSVYITDTLIRNFSGYELAVKAWDKGCRKICFISFAADRLEDIRTSKPIVCQTQLISLNPSESDLKNLSTIIKGMLYEEWDAEYTLGQWNQKITKKIEGIKGRKT